MSKSVYNRVIYVICKSYCLLDYNGTSSERLFEASDQRSDQKTAQNRNIPDTLTGMIRRLLPIFGKNIFYSYLSALFKNIREIYIELVEETEVSVSTILIFINSQAVGWDS